MYCGILLMTTRQGARHDILPIGLELDGELVAEHGNHREPLVEEVLEAEMVGPYDERPRPGPPMPHDFDKADELTFVCRKLGMMRRNGMTEERQGPCALVKHDIKVGARCIIDAIM
jgi:hypothetical protein